MELPIGVKWCSNSLMLHWSGTGCVDRYIFLLTAPTFCRSHYPLFSFSSCLVLLPLNISSMVGKKYYGLTGTKLNVAVGVIAGLDFLLFGYDQGKQRPYNWIQTEMLTNYQVSWVVCSLSNLSLAPSPKSTQNTLLWVKAKHIPRPSKVSRSLPTTWDALWAP